MAEKVRVLEDGAKVLEEELLKLSKALKLSEEEVRELKKKLDQQTQSLMLNKKQRSTNLSSEDVAGLAIFKNAIKESSMLRNVDLKKKLGSLKQSLVFTLGDKNKRVSQD